MLVPFYFWQGPCLCAPSPQLEASSNAGARLQPLSCNLGTQPRALQPLGCVVDFSLLSALSSAAPWPRLGQVLGLCPKTPQPFGCLGGFVLIPASLWLRKGHFWGFVPKPHGEAFVPAAPW